MRGKLSKSSSWTGLKSLSGMEANTAWATERSAKAEFGSRAPTRERASQLLTRYPSNLHTTLLLVVLEHEMRPDGSRYGAFLVRRYNTPKVFPQIRIVRNPLPYNTTCEICESKPRLNIPMDEGYPECASKRECPDHYSCVRAAPNFGGP